MFDRLDVVEATLVVAGTTASDIERLQAVNRVIRMMEAAEAEIIIRLGRSTGWVSDSEHPEWDVLDRRLIQVGADGTPCVDETLPLEIAAARGTSVGVACSLIRDVINLEARHPLTWAAVQSGRVPVWQARKVAERWAGLTAEQAGRVDEMVAPALGRVGTGRLTNLIRAAIMRIAPDTVISADRWPDGGRHVRIESEYDAPETSFVSATLDTADAIFLDATLNRLADILHDRGDTTGRECRRATALGILATPAYALSLLGVHTRRHLDPDHTVTLPTDRQVRRSMPVAQVYVHLSDETLFTGDGVVRVERLGPALISQLSRIVGHARVRVTPVLRVPDIDPAVDAYEIPTRIREHVFLRDRFEVFPYSSREARHQDLDHTVPYHPGPPGQTRPSNLGPLSRRAHRAKTLAGWTVDQPAPGVYLWHTGLGQTFTVGPSGTIPISTS